MITIRRMAAEEMSQLADIDRSEAIHWRYLQEGATIRSVPAPQEVPTWNDNPDKDYPWSMAGRIASYGMTVAQGCPTWGAFDSQRLVGVIIYRGGIAPGVGEIDALQVSRHYRGQDIGHRLVMTLVEHARAADDAALYVSSSPSLKTVQFYMRCGFRPTAEPDLDRLKAEPHDIHMTISLDSAASPSPITIREISVPEVDRICEIDRSERITKVYRQRGVELIAEEVDLDWGTWDPDPTARWSLASRISEWTAAMSKGSTAWGAFDCGRLVGICVYRPRLTETVDELFVLHVSRVYRGQGLGCRLAERLVTKARASGATALYVTAAQSANTVHFYLGLGFGPTAAPHPRRLLEEPVDIHMVMPLS